jgi:endothelin-converting enzyme
MSSPSSSVKPPTRHNSSWISRLYRQPDRKHHSQEQESLLVDDQPDSDVEAQEALQQPQSRLQGFQRKPVKTFKSLGNAISRNWKQILIACILTLLVALIALLVRFYLQHGGQGNTSISVCTSAACVHAASGILYNLDPAFVQIASSKDPSKTACTNYFKSTAKDLSTAACTDFNKLVCGGFDQRHDLRPDQGDMFTGTLMVEDSQTILRHILEGDASEIPSADRPNFEKLKADYDACMDEKNIQGKGVEPLKELTEHVKELFAASEEARKASPVRSDHAQQGVTDASTTKLTDALLYMEKFEISAMVSSGVGVSCVYNALDLSQIIFFVYLRLTAFLCSSQALTI